MNISSAQTNYLTTSSDVGIIAQEIDTISDTITLTSSTGSSYYYNTGAGAVGSSGTISISGSSGGYTIASGSTITLNDINIRSVSSADGLVRLTIESEKGIIQSVRNTIITIDEDDPTSIVTTLETV